MAKKSRIKHFATLLLNPFWKNLARYISDKCGKCEQVRLLSVFDDYSAGLSPECEKCSSASKALWPLIRLLFKFGINDGAVKRLLKDSLVRRCMLSVIKGISVSGIRHPKPTGVPIVVV